MLDSNSSLSFEDLYNKAEKKIKDDKNNELIEENEAIYFYKNPHVIQFSFPNGTIKDIFIANLRQFSHINKIFIEEKDLEVMISQDGTNYDRGDKIDKNYDAKYVKYVISSIIKEKYMNTISQIKNKDTLSLNELSLNYEYYLENTSFVIDKNNFFINTTKRKEFFKFLDDELVNSDYIALCGLEGIGKTASILAYLRYSTKSYFYFNIKAIDKLLVNRDISTIRKILLRELYRYISFEEATKYYDILNKILEKNITAIEIFKQIFEQIKKSSKSV